MDLAAIIIIMFISGLLVLVFYIIGIYNRLLDAKNRVEDQFKPINNELNKLSEIMPDLIESIKKYVKHEDKIINEIENINSKLINATSINGKIKNQYTLNKSLEKLFSLKEIYPELKKSKTFNNIEKKIKELEDKIEYASEFYNDTVQKYNNSIKENISKYIAKIFKFKEIDIIKVNKQ